MLEVGGELHCVDAVFSKGCNVTSSVVGCKMSWRMRSDSKQRETMHTTDTPQVTQITEGGTHKQVEHTHSTWLQGRKSNQNCLDYNLVNEQEQQPPHRIHARHQGTQSPQISVTFQHFNSVSFIWCRGPRPKAHWYMHTDGTNYRIVTTTPPFDE